MKELILNNKPTKAGRIYDTEILLKLADQINDGIILGRNDFPDLDHPLQKEEAYVVRLSKVAFSITDGIVYNNALYANVEALDTPEGNTLKALLQNSEIVFRPALDADNNLLYISAIPKNTDALNL